MEDDSIRAEFIDNVISFVRDGQHTDNRLDKTTVVHVTGFEDIDVDFFIDLFPNLEALEVDSHSIMRWSYDNQTRPSLGFLLPTVARVASLKVNRPRDVIIPVVLRQHNHHIFA